MPFTQKAGGLWGGPTWWKPPAVWQGEGGSLRKIQIHPHLRVQDLGFTLNNIEPPLGCCGKGIGI